jgi:hypothetical protein
LHESTSSVSNLAQAQSLGRSAIAIAAMMSCVTVLVRSIAPCTVSQK